MKSAEREHAGVSCGTRCANRVVPLARSGAKSGSARAVSSIERLSHGSRVRVIISQLRFPHVIPPVAHDQAILNSDWKRAR
jgi:predicted NAD/FAD-binding protein